MRRDDFFGFRLNDSERQLLVRVAAQWERSQSDVVRLLIRSAAEEIERSKVNAVVAKGGSAN